MSDIGLQTQQSRSDISRRRIWGRGLMYPLNLGEPPRIENLDHFDHL